MKYPGMDVVYLLFRIYIYCDELRAYNVKFHNKLLHFCAKASCLLHHFAIMLKIDSTVERVGDANGLGDT